MTIHPTNTNHIVKIRVPMKSGQLRTLTLLENIITLLEYKSLLSAFILIQDRRSLLNRMTLMSPYNPECQDNYGSKMALDKSQNVFAVGEKVFSETVFFDQLRTMRE